MVPKKDILPAGKALYMFAEDAQQSVKREEQNSIEGLSSSVLQHAAKGGPVPLQDAACTM